MSVNPGLAARSTTVNVNQAKDVVTSLESALGLDVFRSGSIKTNLPTDNLGFWLTGGVPTVLIFVHILLQLLGETGVGICFVPSTRDNQLDNSQIQYITQFCLNQASDYDCYNDNGFLKEECKFRSLCDMNTTASESNNETISSLSLFVYRNYVWLLFLFAFVRRVPHMIWNFYFTEEVALAVEVITKFAESKHSRDNSKIEALKTLHESNGLKKRHLIGFYIVRKVLEICFDLVVIILISKFLKRNSTQYHKLVFVCDLHNDPNNVFLCEIIKNRFISCNVSFGFEFILTLEMLLGVLVVDFLFQIGFLIYLSCPKCVQMCAWCRSVCRQSNSQEGGTNGTNETEFNVTSMYSLRDLILICMLQKQNKAKEDSSFNIMMVEKMIGELAEPNGANTSPSAANQRNSGRTLPEEIRALLPSDQSLSARRETPV